MVICSLPERCQCRRQQAIPVILARQEAEIGKIVVPGHPRQKSSRPHLNRCSRLKHQQGLRNRRDLGATEDNYGTRL
jgi:hypothetical protein